MPLGAETLVVWVVGSVGRAWVVEMTVSSCDLEAMALVAADGGSMMEQQWLVMCCLVLAGLMGRALAVCSCQTGAVELVVSADAGAWALSDVPWVVRKRSLVFLGCTGEELVVS